MTTPLSQPEALALVSALELYESSLRRCGFGPKAEHITRLRATLAALYEDRERLAHVKKHATQNTAHDLFGDGGNWHVGIFSPDNSLSFYEAIDRARGQGKGK